ncbi:hypothetical protein, partial [Rhodococcus sp. 5G237]
VVVPVIEDEADRLLTDLVGVLLRHEAYLPKNEGVHQTRDGSQIPFCHGEPGSMNEASTPVKRHQSRIAYAVILNRLGFDAASFLEEDAHHVQALPRRAA